MEDNAVLVHECCYNKIPEKYSATEAGFPRSGGWEPQRATGWGVGTWRQHSNISGRTVAPQLMLSSSSPLPPIAITAPGHVCLVHTFLVHTIFRQQP